VASLKALFLNCSLKPSPRVSNTQALIDKTAAVMTSLGVETESARVVDFNVAFGSGMDEGYGDGWPTLLDKIRQADILVVATPIWLGERSSVAKMVAERLDATTYQTDSRNQHEMYGKVAGALVTGESDGGQSCIKSILYDLSIAGFTVPPNSDCYWVGEAGLGGPYLELDGDTSHFVNERVRWMAHNMTYMAGLLKKHPIPTDLVALSKEAGAVSRPPKPEPTRG